MAEAGAHVSGGVSLDDTPSVFEVLAQESLMDAVRPALQHALKVLVEWNPGRLGFLWRTFDELFLCADLLVQNHFLSRTAASFSENFYALKRVSTSYSSSSSSSSNHSPFPGSPLRLNRKCRWRSVLLLCLVPYLKIKLEHILTRIKEEEEFSIHVHSSRVQRTVRRLLGIQTYLCSVWGGWRFAHMMLYVLGRTATHCPLLWMSGTTLQHLTLRDLQQLEARVHTDTHTLSVFQRLFSHLSIFLSSSVSLGLFLLQFLDWWFSSSDTRSSVSALTSLATPPPPPLHLLHPSSSSPAGQVTGHVTLCPLCGRVRTNPTVVSTSGFVFCYGCVFLYVKSHQRCPITAYPTQLHHLVKIYEPDT